jgi:hypothetical protein
MTYNSYIQPSVKVMEIQMIQTLCASGGSTLFSPINPSATTDEQL